MEGERGSVGRGEEWCVKGWCGEGEGKVCRGVV